MKSAFSPSKNFRWQVFFNCIFSIYILTSIAMPVCAQQSSGTDSAVLTAEPVSVPDSSATQLTERQVIELGLKYSEKLTSLNTNVAIANHRLQSSGWLRNPELRISDVSTRYYTEEFDELRAGLRFRFPQLGELGEDRQQARVDLWDRRVDKTRFRQELITKIRKDFADVLMYDDLAEIAQKRISKANERIQIIEELVKLGQRSIVYFTKAKMWQAESNNDLARALQNQRLARRKLAKRTNMADDTPIIINDLPEVTQDVEGLISLAIEKRPEIDLIYQRIELANSQKRLEYLKLIPWFNFVEFSYHAEKNRREDWGEFMTGITLPLFNWNLGNIKATNLAVQKKADESDAIKETIEEEVRSTYNIYQDLLLDWKNFKSMAEEFISLTTDIVQQAQKHETLMPDEVVEMEWTIFDTQRLLIEKRREVAHALFDLYFAIGIDGYEQLDQ
ncbi:TolC family protein [candidate division KSB1 bacterium]|nr:TolC family protein [candidate division KSB1 bacterium]